jgi:hypothetical protein
VARADGRFLVITEPASQPGARLVWMARSPIRREVDGAPGRPADIGGPAERTATSGKIGKKHNSFAGLSMRCCAIGQARDRTWPMLYTYIGGPRFVSAAKPAGAAFGRWKARNLKPPISEIKDACLSAPPLCN